ncbi:MAG: RNA 2',3'-cyclic phosphodiesterase [Syntrophales bacterium]
MDEKMIRAFLAIDPPEEILREIGRIQERLRKLIYGEVRWVRPEAIHLTLKFFGDIPESAIADIAAVVEKAAAAEAPLTFSIGGAGIFPDQRRPRVLWLGMDGDVPRLLRFQKEIESGLGVAGFPAEERPFRPHLTLARIKSPRGLTGLERALEKGEGYAAGQFTAAGIGLIRSELTPRGAVYTKLKWFPFA